MQYGKCLETLFKLKKQLSPLFRDFFNSFEKQEIRKEYANTWEFFIKSLEFLKFFLLTFNNNPKYLLAFFYFKKKFNKCFDQWQSVPYINSLITFATAVKNKTVQHYYIETLSLYNFLTTLEIKSMKDMMQYIQQSDNISDNTITFAVHLPDEKSFTINFKIKDGKIKTLLVESNGDFFVVQCSEKDNVLKIINRNKAIKMCFNIIFYTKCFSANVRDGVPSDTKEKVLKNENAKTLSPFKEIEKFTQKEISAHFRRAHFRFCGSDYYKGKKGKWVFVKGSMINADAKTIIKE